ncbi:MAG: serine--tRNA ligase, partial [Spiroplasma sp.]|nr:serine--tRNA ligase [Mycoplasmatales bacterium]
LTELKITEEAKAKLNEKSKLIGVYKKENKDTTELMQEILEIKKLANGEKVNELFNSFTSLLMEIPNIPDESCPDGLGEEDNLEIKKWGVIKKFDFPIKAHYELGEKTKTLDFQRAAKIAKARFVITKGFAAKLERAITNYMLDTHTNLGYLEFGVPVIVSEEALLGSGQLPKFESDLFKLQRTTNEDDEFSEHKRDFYLIPTAEVVLANYHRDEIINAMELPLSYQAYSQCFRKESGSAGRDTAGMIRLHQFGKVELFKYAKKTTTFEHLESIVNSAESILQGLELPYRLVELCTGDIGFGATKTFDLEVWLPSQDTYRECSSCSSVGDFQARRAKIRYKDDEGKSQFVHMLNGSGTATGRILVAVMENYQNKDGTVSIPKVLERYFI